MKPDIFRLEEILNNVIDDFNSKWTSHEEKLDGIRDYATEIQRLPFEENQWISVKERQPEFDTLVLVYCKLYGRYIGSYNFIGEFQGEKYGNWHDGKNLGVLPPIFWQPLPEPPSLTD